MYASAVAETPPVISRVTPRSQVINARSIDEKRIVVVKKICL